MNRAFICNIIPNHLVHHLHYPQAANNFCFNLINNNCFNNVYSIVPISYYDERIKSDEKVRYFSKHGRVKYLGIIYSILFNIRCSFIAKNADTVWFYNIVKANILSYILLRYIFRKKVYVILLDYTPNNNRLSIQYYIPYFIKKSFGVISLSSRTEIIHRNMDYIAGIIPIHQISKEIYKPKDKLRFFFSGNLGKHTGFGLALDIFKDLSNFELYVTGFGELGDYKLNKYENIKYLGYLSFDEYIKLYKKIDICLSFRDPDFPENKNNFPSKILEYFSFNKIVISTIKYPELNGFNYFNCEFKKQSVIETIENIGAMKIETLEFYLDNSEALKNNFSEIKWREVFNRLEKNNENKS